MCTFFTLTYSCGHTQTSHRCPRSTIYVYGKNGEQVPRIDGCDSTHAINADLRDNCIDCKMKDGLMPGVTTGVNGWSQWGPKEEALSARVKSMKEGIQKMDSPVESSAVQAEDWEEQVRAALMDQPRGQTSTPETMTSSARSGSMQAEWRQEAFRVKDQDEENDDWMWGGMMDFGAESARNGGKDMPMRMHQKQTARRSQRLGG
ncbi:uncharacterized protein N0V89_007700 [Didymosphaeria variabile]|uniref:Uncharacterized protein n=1 Tax=Didymosphaeria variabile TaxID=1932322 RepID=A0A9W8XK38_9PLEO|nr:uncharacterized protein N0V89_007700 [Didymosphaeria variabile]KAJ4352352.1 hypothetical protein N0V89_007700 [Didymosphaeria variabile]